jgi:hypothetical protein
MNSDRELTPAELEEVSGGAEAMVATFKYGGFRMDVIAFPSGPAHVCVSNNYGQGQQCNPV